MSNTRYLCRLGGTWYVRVKVPRPLQGRVGNTHIRRALGTGDLDHANSLKWPLVARIQAHLAALGRSQSATWVDPLASPGIAAGAALGAPAGSAPDGLADAPAVRSAATALPSRLTTRAIAQGGTLDALVDRWLSSADYLKQTKQQHREAYGVLRQFLGRDVAPTEVTGELAVEFVDSCIKRTGWSYATKRRKVNSLVAFWNWLAESLVVPKGANPWTGFRLASKGNAGKATRTKRPYSDDELITLFGQRPDYPGLADVMVCGLLTGMRIEEVCGLRCSDVTPDEDGCWWVNIRKAKTKAGIRRIAVAHGLLVPILQRRTAAASGKDAQLFPEFRGGGYDAKLSWAVSKAFGRFRKLRGLTGETDFHSFRRTFITTLENLGVDQVQIARYVGHELPTLAFAVYSGGSNEATARAIARRVQVSAEVEGVLRVFLAGH